VNTNKRKVLESWLSFMLTLEEFQNPHKPLEVMGDVNPRIILEVSRSNECILRSPKSGPLMA
jgi:hypothetical protein